MSEVVESNVPSKTSEAGHELTDLSPKNIALFGLALALIILAAVFVTAALFRYFHAVEASNEAVPSPLSYTREPPVGPKLSVNPGQDLQTLRTTEDSALKSYEWIDRDKETVRIPIDRAIDILAQRSLLTRPPSGEKGVEEKLPGQTEKKGTKGIRR